MVYKMHINTVLVSCTRMLGRCELGLVNNIWEWQIGLCTRFGSETKSVRFTFPILVRRMNNEGYHH